ncbi:helix-turn-helix domain-containing protein, partial [Mesomycoplasma ovipneumoniae]|uniref:helix-turn-helix domain-containing protein n=1 Tax=Mesomycoplasma ovipneumoniae TaxID=29562 RepID=UPI0015CEFC90
MKAEQRGKRLATLRRLLALNQTDFSELTGLSQPLISLMERGERSVTDSVVLDLARITKTPVSFFEVTTTPPPGVLSFRKLATTSASSREAATARFEELERVATHLGRSAEYPSPELPSAEDDLDGDDIEDLAQKVRVRLRLEPEDPILNLTRALERRGIIVASLASVDDGILDGHDGASRATGSSIRPVIG